MVYVVPYYVEAVVATRVEQTLLVHAGAAASFVPAFLWTLYSAAELNVVAAISFALVMYGAYDLLAEDGTAALFRWCELAWSCCRCVFCVVFPSCCG